jgi:hypothetical protein
MKRKQPMALLTVASAAMALQMVTSVSADTVSSPFIY